jgi:hypothetical protein
MSRHVLIVAIVLSLLAGFLPARIGATEAPSALPLAAGNRWVLRDAELGGTQAIAVTRSAAGLVLHGLPGAGDLRVRTAGRAVVAWDPADRRWEPFLRLGAAAGTTYAVDLAGTAIWRSLLVTVDSRRTVVTDARGKTFRNCVRLTFAARKPIADAGLEELVFAPGVGFVRTSEQTIAGPRVHLLAALRLR